MVTVYRNEGDALQGDQIAIQAGKIDLRVVSGERKHKSQCGKATRGAFCVIEYPLVSVKNVAQRH